MPSRPTPTANDPVSQAILNARFSSGHVPVPVAASYDIHISGGLADVVASRTFRNAEAHSIEAVLTFPPRSTPSCMPSKPELPDGR